MTRKIILSFILSGLFIFTLAQTDSINHPSKPKLSWFINVNLGTQMSGIKSEDFIVSNFSPLLGLSFGKWVAPAIALKVGYKGWYFNTISDSIKHYYTYIYGEVIVNTNALILKNYTPGIWSLFLHVGSGYFYNNEYNRPNICANFGITNNIRIIKNLLTNIDISAIVGWDIYQGDADILPGLTLGITYLF